MQLRCVVLILGLLYSSQALASEFPVGSFRGTGFLLEKGSLKITDNDMHVYKSSAKIVKRSVGRYEITISARIQTSPTTRLISDKRADVFDLVWNSPNSGKLINLSAMYKDDRATFTITENVLAIKTWVSRHKAWETHTFSLRNE